MRKFIMRFCNILLVVTYISVWLALIAFVMVTLLLWGTYARPILNIALSILGISFMATVHVTLQEKFR